LFKKFGSKKNKNDGKIIQDEEDEVVEVTWKDYQYVLTNFYGHWIQFLIIFLMVASSYSFVVQYNYLIGQWASASEADQFGKYWDNFFKIGMLVLGITVVNCIR
jgi:hypothetical protein